MKSSSKELFIIGGVSVALAIPCETCLNKEPSPSERKTLDSALVNERSAHCHDLIDAVVNEASIIHSTIGTKDTSEPITCQQLKSHQDRRVQAKNVCTSAQADLPRYCTDGPDISAQIKQELQKLDNLPFDLDVNCSLGTPVRNLNCGCEETPETE